MPSKYIDSSSDLIHHRLISNALKLVFRNEVTEDEDGLPFGQMTAIFFMQTKLAICAFSAGRNFTIGLGILVDSRHFIN